MSSATLIIFPCKYHPQAIVHEYRYTQGSDRVLVEKVEKISHAFCFISPWLDGEGYYII